MVVAAGTLFVPLLAGGLGSAGCTRKTQTTMEKPPEVNPAPAVEASAAVRVNELTGMAQRFAETAGQLPGNSTEEHAKIMQQVFAELVQILPTLVGPSPGGEFRQRLRVVESSRAQLATGSKSLAPEPTVDTGLRAVSAALNDIGRGSFYTQAQLGDLLDQLGKRVDELDTSRGPSHQQAAGTAVGLASQIVTKMADVLEGRLEQQQGGAAAGTTTPGTTGAAEGEVVAPAPK
jgi:hypothetical protein